MFQFSKQRGGGDSQLFGRLGSIATIALQHRKNVIALDVAEGTNARGGCERQPGTQGGGKVIHVDECPCRQGTRTFDRVFKFPDDRQARLLYSLWHEHCVMPTWDDTISERLGANRRRACTRPAPSQDAGE